MSRKKKKTMTQPQQYAILESAKDELNAIINRQKYAWGYENWTRLHILAGVNAYTKILKLVKSFKQSTTQKHTIAVLGDIIQYSRFLKLPF